MTVEFQSILPRNSSKFEKAEELVSGSRLDAITLDIISNLNDPWKTPAHLLNFIAGELSVDIWDEDWPEWKKRSVVASAYKDHSLKGTEAGIQRYIDIAGGELLETVTPPAGFFLSEDLTKEQWEEWLAKMPRLRITLAHGKGVWAPPAGFFLGEVGSLDGLSAFDESAITINTGPALYGRRAWIVYPDGHQQALQLWDVVTTNENRDAVEFERVVIPGQSFDGFFFNEDFFGEKFFDAQNIYPQFYSFSLDQSYVHAESQLSLSGLSVGLEPQDTRFYRESAIGDGGHGFFFGDFFNDRFYGINDGGELLADVMYLLDPAAASPLVDSISFFDISRFRMPAFNAEFLVDSNGQTGNFGFILDESIFDYGALVDEDLSKVEFIMDAVASSQALRDKTLIDFQTTRQRSLAEGLPLDGSVLLDERVRNHL